MSILRVNHAILRVFWWGRFWGIAGRMKLQVCFLQRKTKSCNDIRFVECLPTGKKDPNYWTDCPGTEIRFPISIWWSTHNQTVTCLFFVLKIHLRLPRSSSDTVSKVSLLPKPTLSKGLATTSHDVFGKTIMVSRGKVPIKTLVSHLLKYIFGQGFAKLDHLRYKCLYVALQSSMIDDASSYVHFVVDDVGGWCNLTSFLNHDGNLSV